MNKFIVNNYIVTTKRAFCHRLFFVFMTMLLVIAQSHADEVIGFTLVDAITDTDIVDLVDNKSYPYENRNMAVRINTNGDNIDQVRIEIHGPINTRTFEGVEPYSSFGDILISDYNGLNFPIGQYTVVASTKINGIWTNAVSLVFFINDSNLETKPVAEEPVAEEPVAEEPIAEEPVAEEPVAEEPVAEEPAPVSEPTDTEKPTVPGNLTANATSSTQVSLAWDASTDLGGGAVAGYDVWRDGAKLDTMTGTSFIDTGVKPGTGYNYQVDCFDDASPRNKSRKSNTALVVTPELTPEPTPEPTPNSNNDSPNVSYISGDLISLHYDFAPDPDDVLSAVFDKAVTEKHQIPFDSLIMVKGTFGSGNKNLYRKPQSNAMDSIWPTITTLDAANNFNTAVNTSRNRWIEVLSNGSDIWVKEGGQSDFSAAVVRAVFKVYRDTGVCSNDCKDIIGDFIHVIQHSHGSKFNEARTTPADLKYLLDNVDYQRIPNGNHPNNGSADLEKKPYASWWNEARASNYGAEISVADNFLDNNRADGSDTVELLHILNVGTDVVNDLDDMLDVYLN